MFRRTGGVSANINKAKSTPASSVETGHSLDHIWKDPTIKAKRKTVFRIIVTTLIAIHITLPCWGRSEYLKMTDAERRSDTAAWAVTLNGSYGPPLQDRLATVVAMRRPSEIRSITALKSVMARSSLFAYRNSVDCGAFADPRSNVP